jgi:broad specificity phosphatase PhoE
MQAPTACQVRHVGREGRAVTRLLLVRHGRSEMNAQGRVQGWLDSPLDETGREQARALARRLEGESPVVVYTSTLQRAQATAEIIAGQLGVPLVADGRLRERNPGAITGLTSEEIRARFPKLVRKLHEGAELTSLPEAERAEAFRERVVEAFGEIADRHLNGAVAVVTHGGVLAAYVGHLLGVETGRYLPLSFANGSLSIVEVDGARSPRVRLLNDRCHLGLEG